MTALVNIAVVALVAAPPAIVLGFGLGWFFGEFIDQLRWVASRFTGGVR